MTESNKTFYGACIMTFMMGGAGIVMSSAPFSMAYMGLGVGATFGILLALSRIEAAIRGEK